MGQPKHRLPLALALTLAAICGMDASVARAKDLVWELEPAATPAPVPVARPKAEASSGGATAPSPTSATPAAVSSTAVASTALVWTLDTEPVAELPGLNGSPVASATTPAGPPVLVGVPLKDPYPAPNLGGAVPSAYKANWGDYFIGGSAGTPGKLRDGQPDGSVNMGIGFGDASRLIGIELDWNIGSTRNFNANGTFDIGANRILVNQSRLQVVVGGGVQGLYSYGNEGKPAVNGYGVVTVATPLRTPNPFFNQVLQISAGIGGNNFASLDANFEGPSTGYFAALGMEITSNVGLSMGWSGRGANLNLSYTPLRDLPFTINVLAADVFNNSPFGTVGVLSVSWGDNFRTALF